jgi:hypothetical protein
MAGDERHSKHHQDVSASSAGPSVKTKKLAKRKRPMPRDSSSEDSPHSASTSESPNEMELLKMHSPEVHTNREIVNYSKEDPMNMMHLRNKPCYNSSKERGTDERFWTFFHQDWY